jgi:hypothetical protein
MDLISGYSNFKYIRIRIIIRIHIRIRFQIENHIRVHIRQKIIHIRICIRKYLYPLLSEYEFEYDQLISNQFAPPTCRPCYQHPDLGRDPPLYLALITPLLPLSEYARKKLQHHK